MNLFLKNSIALIEIYLVEGDVLLKSFQVFVFTIFIFEIIFYDKYKLDKFYQKNYVRHVTN